MNRAQRRRADREQGGPNNWRQGIKALHAESGGAIILQVIRPPEALALVAEALAGDTVAAGCLQAFTQMLHRLDTAPPGEGPVCVACCSEPAANAYNMAVAIPARDTPGNALGFLVCEACGTSVAAIQGHAAAACREIWPNLRQIRPTHASGGRA